MLFSLTRFNTYFLAFFLLAGAGCQSDSVSPPTKADSKKAATTSKRKKKEVSTIQLHLETNPDGLLRTTEITVFRAAPTQLQIEKLPFLTETDVVRAAVVPDHGGFVIQLFFNSHGQIVLDMTTTSNKGRRIAIRSDFGQKRWLAAPIIARNLSQGTLTFTPDCSLEEAERIVRGLNYVAEKANKQNRFLPK